MNQTEMMNVPTYSVLWELSCRFLILYLFFLHSGMYFPVPSPWGTLTRECQTGIFSAVSWKIPCEIKQINKTNTKKLTKKKSQRFRTLRDRTNEAHNEWTCFLKLQLAQLEHNGLQNQMSHLSAGSGLAHRCCWGKYQRLMSKTFKKTCRCNRMNDYICPDLFVLVMRKLYNDASWHLKRTNKSCSRDRTNSNWKVAL